MREIKFRAWDKINKNMLYNVSTGTVTIWYKEISSKSQNCVFMQFTGLKDKNGKDIFEGDILEDTITNPQNGDELPYRKFEVYWNSNYASFALKDLLNPDSFWENNDQETMWDIAGLKVIGNVYEDPKLLERIE